MRVSQDKILCTLWLSSFNDLTGDKVKRILTLLKSQQNPPWPMSTKLKLLVTNLSCLYVKTCVHGFHENHICLSAFLVNLHEYKQWHKQFNAP